MLIYFFLNNNILKFKFLNSLIQQSPAKETSDPFSASKAM